jgi:hypothetical protein
VRWTKTKGTPRALSSSELYAWAEELETGGDPAELPANGRLVVAVLERVGAVLEDAIDLDG